ncbi:hypothetical protein [Parvularcula dongshanensis]|uniref:Cell division protein FtsN n=1 Tax=Parvularcula dongshanensis TaxID=1173995 RepID=A0A840I3Y9_9PROT|nr:hypothetical protein [Parvularcula dongshanensis]MBB4659589.1 cell division protein FtsN [Parvularcula dongshanensis]
MRNIVVGVAGALLLGGIALYLGYLLARTTKAEAPPPVAEQSPAAAAGPSASPEEDASPPEAFSERIGEAALPGGAGGRLGPVRPEQRSEGEREGEEETGVPPSPRLFQRNTKLTDKPDGSPYYTQSERFTTEEREKLASNAAPRPAAPVGSPPAPSLFERTGKPGSGRHRTGAGDRDASRIR